MIISNEIQDSPTLKFSELAREMNSRNSPIISLGLGEPSFPTPSSIVKATVKAIQEGHDRYSTPQGLYKLRKLLSDKLRKENCIECEPEHIVVTPGAKQALSLALMSILVPEDEVINITPCYVSFIPQIKMAEPQAKVINFDLNKKDLSLDLVSFEKQFTNKTKAVIFNFPHNPTGKTLSDEKFSRLVEILKKQDCYIISDEIYEKLNHDGTPHRSYGSISEIKERVITINGFSKAYSMTGWRIGYLVANPSIIRKVSKLQQHLNTNTTTFIQKGLADVMPIDETFLQSYNNELSKKAHYAQDVLENHPVLKYNIPTGGLFSFLNISNSGLDSDTFSFNLLQNKRIATTPGISFGANWDDHIRISLATNYNDFCEGVDKISEFSRNF